MTSAGSRLSVTWRRCAALAAFGGMALAGTGPSGLPLPLPLRLGSPASAAEAAAHRTARQHFQQGEGHYTAGKYAAALAEYQAGYDVEPLPGFLVNIAQCQRRMGDLERARATYGKFVLVAPDSPLTPEVRGLIQELDRLIAETAAAAGRTSAGAAKPAAPVMSGRRLAMTFDTTNEVLPFDSESSGTAAPGTDLRVVAPSADAAATDSGSGGTRAHNWWLWSSLAAVAAGAATMAFILSAPDATTIHDGSLGTLRR